MSLYKGTQLISGAIPDMANQSLSNINSSGQALFDAKVNKTGDTMTGNLAIKKSHPTIVVKHTDLTFGTNPSSIYYGDSYMLADTNGNSMGSLSEIYQTDGAHFTRLWQKKSPSEESYAIFDVGFNASGNSFCNFPNTTRCDGQFFPLWRDLISVDTSLNGSSELPYTIPEIENKGFFHMALITMTVNTGASSGNYVNGEIRSYISNIVSILRVRTRTASTMTSSGSCWIPVGVDGKIYVNRNTNWNGSMSVLRCMGYRRIGYNVNE